MVARIISLVALAAVLLIIAGLFFQVMVGFLVPMFLALLMVIMFRPLQQWLTVRCRGHVRVAAGLTTAIILLAVFLPLLVAIFQAATESIALYHQIGSQDINVRRMAELVVNLGGQVGLHLEADNVRETLLSRVQEWLYPLARGTTQFLGEFLLGLFVMTVSLYYFLAEGPEMAETLMRIFPVEGRYKQAVVDQFVNISRAVVLATLLSALLQGLLVGVGLYFAGFSTIFLLTLLAMLMSMVPFIGAPAVWVPACLWLYFYDERTTAAIVLAVFCTVVVSTVDNVVKPMVLHGRSNLHPLLALLSVMGGVQALGPLGIFIGPMVVALLQTLLGIFNTELEAMGKAS